MNIIKARLDRPVHAVDSMDPPEGKKSIFKGKHRVHHRLFVYSSAPHILPDDLYLSRWSWLNIIKARLDRPVHTVDSMDPSEGKKSIFKGKYRIHHRLFVFSSAPHVLPDALYLSRWSWLNIIKARLDRPVHAVDSMDPQRVKSRYLRVNIEFTTDYLCSRVHHIFYRMLYTFQGGLG